MKKESLQDYESRVRSVPGATKIDFNALHENYLPLYSKARPPKKYYDGDCSTIMFDFLKEKARYGMNRKIRRELAKGIKDKRLTKIFYDKEMMFKSLEAFDLNFVSTKAWMPAFKQALRLVIESMKVTKLQPIPPEMGEDIGVTIKKKSSVLGFSGYGKTKESEQDWMIENAIRIKNDIAMGIPFEDIFVCPAIALTRSQLGILGSEGEYVPPVDDDDLFKWKTRLIWALSAEMVRVESQYARPLIDYLSYAWYNCATGKSDGNIKTLLDCFNGTHWISVDLKQYDATVQQFVIKEAFEIIKMFFDAEYHQEIDFICYKFIYTDILMPDGYIYSKRKGIPSGSYFTQLVGSICNMLMILTFMCHKIGLTDQQHDRQVKLFIPSSYTTDQIGLIAMGDDDIFTWDRTIVPFTKEEMDDFFKATFGISINYDKRSMGTIREVKNFLKRDWRGNGCYRDPVDLFLHFMHPERIRTYDDYSAWHVLYGYFYCYPATFQEVGMSEGYIIDGMRRNGGVKCLENMPTEELPGALGQLKRSNYHAWELIIASAMAKEAQMS